jgi:hypothetical protein
MIGRTGLGMLIDIQAQRRYAGWHAERKISPMASNLRPDLSVYYHPWIFETQECGANQPGDEAIIIRKAMHVERT